MKLPIRQLLLVMALAASAYAALLFASGSGSTGMLVRLDSAALWIAVALCLASYVLRGLRWWLWMAHFGRTLPWRSALRIYLSGYTFTPTPGNIGEAVRGLMLAQEPLSAAQSLSIYGAERLADLLALLLLSLPVALWLLSAQLPGQRTGVYATAALLLGLAAVAALVAWCVQRGQHQAKPGSRLDRWRGRWPWLSAAWACLAVRPWRWAGLTLGAWGLQGAAVWVLSSSRELSPGLVAAGSSYALAMVGGAASLLPAGLGGMEALFSGLLTLQGVPLAEALALTVEVRLVTLWLAVAVGAVALFYSAALRRDIRWR